MIEINVKAKGSDPWDTPPLTWEQFLAKRAEGFLCAYWICDGDNGWKLYDNCNPRSIYEQADLHKYFSTPNKWQIRAHAKHRVVLVQPISFQHAPWGDGNKRTYVQHILDLNMTSLKAKIEQIKGLRPDMRLLTPHATWYTVSDTEGAPLVFA